MPPPSKVSLLPDDIRDELDQRLIAAGFGRCEELSEWLFDKGFEISKTTVNERAKKLKYRLAAITASTEAAKMIAKAAPDEADDRSNAVIAIVQSEIFEAILQLEEAVQAKDKIARIEMLNKVAKNIATLTRASVARNKHASEVRRSAIEEAAQKAGDAARDAGVSEETIEQIRDRVMKGVK
jgi:vacuolar-type H+-ATPase catalytic subunit A/Vma1